MRRRVAAMFGMTGGFEGALGNRRLKHFVPSRAHINTLVASTGRDMLARGRWLARNNGYANNAVEAWAGNVVGAGITPSFQVRNKALKQRLVRKWSEWVDEADAEGITDFYGLQRRAAREMFIAGEVFFRFYTRREGDGAVPLQMQLLPSEMLPISKTEMISGGAIRQKVAAMHALFIKTQASEFSFDDPKGNDPQADRELDLQPGSVVILDPGEEIQTSTPAESGATYEPFQYRTLLQVSTALGIPYAILTNDMVKANYSNTRAALLEFRRRMDAFQHSVMVFQMCRPTFMRFLDVADVSGAIHLPNYADRRRKYQRAAWLPPRWEWVDPLKDANAEIAQIEAGLKSRTQAIAERGYDAETVDEEIAADHDRERRLGLNFSERKPVADVEEPEGKPGTQP
jgi:capsid protein